SDRVRVRRSIVDSAPLRSARVLYFFFAGQPAASAPKACANYPARAQSLARFSPEAGAVSSALRSSDPSFDMLPWLISKRVSARPLELSISQAASLGRTLSRQIVLA